MSSEAAEDAGALCIGCGMCCDGTLFHYASLKPDEVPLLTARGFAFEQHGDKLYFSQPCPMARGGCCAMYEERPATCRSYRCALLRKVDAGEVGLEEARGKVATAKTLLAAITADEPELASRKNRERALGDFAEGFRTAPPEAKAELGARHLKLQAVEIFLGQWFRPKSAETEENVG